MSKFDIVMRNVQDFFSSNQEYYEIMKSISESSPPLHQENKQEKKQKGPSLRQLEIFIKELPHLDQETWKKITHDVPNASERPSDVFMEMKRAQTRFTKKYFDIYCRKSSPQTQVRDSSTSIAQANFFRWFFESNLYTIYQKSKLVIAQKSAKAARNPKQLKRAYREVDNNDDSVNIFGETKVSNQSSVCKDSQKESPPLQPRQGLVGRDFCSAPLHKKSHILPGISTYRRPQ